MANKHKSRAQKAHDQSVRQAPIPGAGARLSGPAQSQQDLLAGMQNPGKARGGPAKKRK